MKRLKNTDEFIYLDILTKIYINNFIKKFAHNFIRILSFLSGGVSV